MALKSRNQAEGRYAGKHRGYHRHASWFRHAMQGYRALGKPGPKSVTGKLHVNDKLFGVVHNLKLKGSHHGA